MVKKGKEKAPASGSSSSKKPAKKAAAPDDDLLIFTTDKKKKGGPSSKPGDAAGSSSAVTDGPPAPPKPTVKQIIGGQSWTGKLPVNLLSEHCQRMKWEKPDYDMVRFIARPWEALQELRHPRELLGRGGGVQRTIDLTGTHPPVLLRNGINSPTQLVPWII